MVEGYIVAYCCRMGRITRSNNSNGSKATRGAISRPRTGRRGEARQSIAGAVEESRKNKSHTSVAFNTRNTALTVGVDALLLGALHVTPPARLVASARVLHASHLHLHLHRAAVVVECVSISTSPNRPNRESRPNSPRSCLFSSAPPVFFFFRRQHSPVGMPLLTMVVGRIL